MALKRRARLSPCGHPLAFGFGSKGVSVSVDNSREGNERFWPCLTTGRRSASSAAQGIRAQLAGMRPGQGREFRRSGTLRGLRFDRPGERAKEPRPRRGRCARSMRDGAQGPGMRLDAPQRPQDGLEGPGEGEKAFHSPVMPLWRFIWVLACTGIPGAGLLLQRPRIGQLPTPRLRSNI